MRSSQAGYLLLDVSLESTGCNFVGRLDSVFDDGISSASLSPQRRDKQVRWHHVVGLIPAIVAIDLIARHWSLAGA